MFRLFLGALVLTQACAVEPVGGRSDAIVNGTRETSMRDVVAVARFGGMGGLCTGTVIGRFAVLTAKHCVFDDTNRAVPASEMLVVVGNDVNTTAGVEYTREVREIRTTAGSDISSDIEFGNDIAILLLSADIEVPARGVARSGPTTGASATIVGFGRTSGSTESAGVKYRGTTSISGVGGRLIETNGTSWTCQGDSGGPLFDSAGNVTGITSFGISGCTSSRSYYTKVVNHLSMVDAALTYVPPCEPETEVCDGADNDCDGVIDNGCTALGDPCTGDGQCQMGACEDVGGMRVCVRECDPRHTIPRCPIGFYCEVLGCGTGRCILGDPGGTADGEPCAADSECASTHCLDVGGTRRCGRSCSPDGEACPSGTGCEAPDGTCGSCLPYDLVTGPRPFGAPCETVDQCATGTCSDGICTSACSGTALCPSGFHCRGGLCVVGDIGGPGAECTTNEDCDASLALTCVDADGDFICAAPCTGGTCTSPGLECGPSAEGDRCLPPGLPLGEACAAHTECRTGLCAGTCTRLCDGGGPCPAGFECRMAGEHSGCFPMAAPLTRDSGCAATGSPARALPLFALAFLFALVVTERRRR